MMLLLGAWGLVRVTMLFGALLAELPSAYQITLSLVRSQVPALAPKAETCLVRPNISRN